MGGFGATLIFGAPFAFLVIALALAIFLMVTWCLWQLWADFKDVFAGQPKFRVIWLHWRSFILWAPICLLAIFAIVGAHIRDGYITHQVYTIRFAQEARSWNQSPPCNAVFCESGAGLQTDMKDATSVFGDKLQSRIMARFDSAARQAEAAGGNAAEVMERLLFTNRDAVFPASFETFSGIMIPSCFWPGFPFSARIRSNCGQRIVLKPLASAYENLRSDFYNAFLNGSASTTLATSDGIDGLRATLQTFVSQKIDGYVEATHTTIDRVFLLSLVLRILVIGSLTFSLVKGFLYILARNVFDHKVGQIPLVVTKGTRTGAGIRAADITSEDDKSFRILLGQQNWYGSFRRNIKTNSPGHFAIPKRGALLLSRLFSGKLLFQRFDVEETESFGGYGDTDTRFVRLDLAEGERLYFRLRNLVGFSESVTLRRHFSLRLATVLQFKLLFPVVEGPGSVVLAAQGGAARLMPQGGIEGSEPLDLLAFDIGGAFHTAAQHGFLGTYLGRVTIFPDPDTVLVRHSGDDRTSAGMKTLRKIAFFVLPF